MAGERHRHGAGPSCQLDQSAVAHNADEDVHVGIGIHFKLDRRDGLLQPDDVDGRMLLQTEIAARQVDGDALIGAASMLARLGELLVGAQACGPLTGVRDAAGHERRREHVSDVSQKSRSRP